MKILNLNNHNIYLHENVYKQLSIILNYNITITNQNESIIINFNDLLETQIIINLHDNGVHVNNFMFTKEKYGQINNFQLDITQPISIRQELSLIVDQLYLKNATQKELNTINMVFAHNNNCPICNSKMKLLHQSSLEDIVLICENNCYKIARSTNEKNLSATFIIFSNHNISTNSIETIDVKIDKIKRVEKLINDYKNNDKYLMEILSNQN